MSIKKSNKFLRIRVAEELAEELAEMLAEELAEELHCTAAGPGVIDFIPGRLLAIYRCELFSLNCRPSTVTTTIYLSGMEKNHFLTVIGLGFGFY